MIPFRISGNSESISFRSKLLVTKTAPHSQPLPYWHIIKLCYLHNIKSTHLLIIFPYTLHIHSSIPPFPSGFEVFLSRSDSIIYFSTIVKITQFLLIIIIFFNLSIYLLNFNIRLFSASSLFTTLLLQTGI